MKGGSAAGAVGQVRALSVRSAPRCRPSVRSDLGRPLADGPKHCTGPRLPAVSARCCWFLPEIHAITVWFKRVLVDDFVAITEPSEARAKSRLNGSSARCVFIFMWRDGRVHACLCGGLWVPLGSRFGGRLLGRPGLGVLRRGGATSFCFGRKARRQIEDAGYHSSFASKT